MDCNCGNKNEGNFSPSVLQVNSTECPVLFHKVVIPATFGDETETPVLMGKYKNALVYYEVNGHAYLYSSDGVPTRLDRGGASVLYVDELPEISKAMQDTLYVSSRGELAVYKSGDKKILNEKPTYYTTLGSNTDGAMTQKAVTDALSALSEEVKNKLAEFKNGVVDKVMPEVNDKVSNMERYVTTKIEDMKRETSTLVNTTTNDVNLMKNSLNKYIEQADIVKNDLLDKIRRNTDSITDTKNSLRNYALISDVNNRVSEVKSELNDNINQSETRVNNTIGQAKTELNGKITEANNKTSALDTKFTKITSDDKAEVTQIKANLATTNSVLSTHKELVDKKFTDVNVEQTSQNSLISDILNAFSKESEKGTNLKLNSSATKVLGVSIHGNLKQMAITGKNLFDPTFANSGQLNSTTKVSDNTITITKRGGNANTIGFYNISPYGMHNFWSNLLKTNTVTLSFEVKHGSGGPHTLRYGLENAIVQSTQTTANWEKYTLIIPKNPDNNYVAFIFYSDGYISNTESDGFSIRNIQVEISDTATEFEPYTGGSYNLFDEFSGLPINSIHGVTLSNQSGVLKLTGKPTVDWLPILVRDNLSLFNKNTYTVVSYNGVSPQLFAQILAYKKDGSGFDIFGSSSSKIFTFVTDSTKYDRYAMKIQLSNKAAYPESVTLYNNFALFRGAFTESNLPEYSPYNTGLARPRPQLPQVIGELSEINIQITNKNLLKLTQQNPLPNFKAIVEPDGSITFSGEIYQWWGTNITVGSAVLIPGNQTHTLSIDKPLPYSMCLAIFGKNGRVNVGDPIIGKGKTSITFTPSEDIVRCHLYLSINGTGWNQNTPIPETNIKVQLEKGDTATPYVKNESSDFTIPTGLNIYKLTDNIYDEVKLENGVAKLIKRVGKLELSGEEYFRTINPENPGQVYVYTNVFDRLLKNSTTCICSHFDIMPNTILVGVKTNKTILSVFSDNGNDLIRIMFSAPDALNLKITDINSFKNWLKAEKAKGTPVTVYYEMKTPTEEEITDQAILTKLNKLIEARTYDGITNISVTGTDLTPEIKVKYMRKIGE